MNVRHVQVRGCLPTLVVLLVIGAALAAAMTTGVAFLVVAAVAGLVAAGVRWAQGLLGGREKETSAARRAADVTIDAEVVEPPEGGERTPKRLE